MNLTQVEKQKCIQTFIPVSSFGPFFLFSSLTCQCIQSLS